LQFSQKLHFIIIVRFKQKFVLLLNFVFEHTCHYLLVHNQTSLLLRYFSFIELCPIEVYHIDIYHVGKGAMEVSGCHVHAVLVYIQHVRRHGHGHRH
jgi:hypothetical protein